MCNFSMNVFFFSSQKWSNYYISSRAFCHISSHDVACKQAPHTSENQQLGFKCAPSLLMHMEVKQLSPGWMMAVSIFHTELLLSRPLLSDMTVSVVLSCRNISHICSG